MISYIISSAAFALGGFLTYYYYFKKGQFNDLEEVKYQLFQEEDSQEK